MREPVVLFMMNPLPGYLIRFRKGDEPLRNQALSGKLVFANIHQPLQIF